MRKILAALALATLFTLTAGSAAFAIDDYPPPAPPRTPSLAGSSVLSTCGTGSPTINYSITLTNSGQATTQSASLVLAAGGQTTTVALGTVGANGTLSGSVAWPTASWTRGAVSATVVVDPAQLAVPLSYPTNCAPVSGALAYTGMSGAILPIGIAGGVLTVVGLGIVLRRSSTRV